MESLRHLIIDHPDLCTPQLVELARRFEDLPPKQLVRTANEAHMSSSSYGTLAGLAFESALDEGQVQIRTELARLYLSLRSSPLLGQPSGSLSLGEILKRARECDVPEICRDVAILTARVLLVDEQWYLTNELADIDHSWLTGQWADLIPRSARSKKLKTIGTTASVIKGHLEDLGQQVQTVTADLKNQLSERDFPGLENRMDRAANRLRGVMGWLTRGEQQVMESHLRFMAALEEQTRRRTSNISLVAGPEEAKKLRSAATSVLNDLVATGEALTQDLTPLYLEILQYLRSEFERWGIDQPSMTIWSERSTYPFQGGEDYLTLRLRNGGGGRITEAAVSFAGGEGVLFEPDRLDLHDIEPGEEVSQVIQVLVADDSPQVSVDWVAEVADEFGESSASEGTIRVQIDRETDWAGLDAMPNPYSTDPIDRPERLHGRADILRTLVRAVRSGQSRYLTGQRRVGKTSVAKVLLEILDKQRFIGVYTSWGEIGGIGAGSFPAVCRQICKRLHDVAAEGHPELRMPELPSVEDFDFAPVRRPARHD